MLSHPTHALKPRISSFTRHFVQPHNIYEENKMKQRIENLSFLAAGIVLFYALNQHLIGRGAAYTCHAIVEQRNNFVVEIGMMAIVSLIVYGAYIAWRNAPILSVSIAAVLVFGLLYLQNDMQGKNFNFAQAKVEKVWGAK
jgi:hypothetical protein